MCLALTLACFVSHGGGLFKPSEFGLLLLWLRLCSLQAWLALRRLAVSTDQPHPGKRSPSTSATSQTSLNFHLLWNVVRGGHRAIYRKLLYFSVTAVCLPSQFELLAVSSGQAEGGSSEANLSKHSAPAPAMVGRFWLDDLLFVGVPNLRFCSFSVLTR